MKRCSDCAFTKGTEANGCADTLLRANLCLVSGEQFFCHMRGTNPAPLCVGYIQALENQPEHPEWRKRLACRLNDVLYLAESSEAVGKAISDAFPEILKELMAP